MRTRTCQDRQDLLLANAIQHKKKEKLLHKLQKKQLRPKKPQKTPNDFFFFFSVFNSNLVVFETKPKAKTPNN